MASDIKAPGRSALWTEAALRALAGTAFLCHEGAEVEDDPLPLHEGAIKTIALDAMAIADAFEQACEERHATECADDIKRIEAMREKVRQTKRYYAQDGSGVVLLTVASVVGATVTFEPHASTGWKESKADLADVLDPELYRPAGDGAPTQEEQDAERVRQIGRFVFGEVRTPLVVHDVSDGLVTFEREPGERGKRMARVCDVLEVGGMFTPARGADGREEASQ